MIWVKNRKIPFPAETEHLFDRHLMNIFLEQYETNFDEITEIVITNYVGKEIVDLPEKLEKLVIQYTNLESLSLPIHSRFIKKIKLEATNLQTIPEMGHLSELEECIIAKSNVQHPPIFGSKTPRIINLSNNYLKQFPIITCPEFCLINLSNNQLNQNDMPAKYKNTCLLGTQQQDKPIFKPYRIEQIENQQVKEHFIPRINEQRNEFIYDPMNFDIPLSPRIRGELPQENLVNTIFGSQSVHSTSVNNNITKSITKIKELTKTYPNNSTIYLQNIYREIPPRQMFLSNLFLMKQSLFQTSMETILLTNLKMWNAMEDRHTKHRITFKELLIRVWMIVNAHEKKSELIERLRQELSDSIGMCFTGRMNRLVNSLVGYVDGIQVNISLKESIQLEMGQIIKKLEAHSLTRKQAKKEAQNLFQEIPEDAKQEENITEAYAQSWIDALEDYGEDDTEDAADTTEDAADTTEDAEDTKDPDTEVEDNMEDTKDPDTEVLNPLLGIRQRNVGFVKG